MLAYLMHHQRAPYVAGSIPDQVEPWLGLAKVKRLLEERCHLPLPLSYLSRIAGCSTFHLVRAFRAVYQETPHQYQIRCRIQNAKQFLADSPLSITDICFDLGFASLGTFSAHFKALVGWSPSIYRARVHAQRREPARFIPDCYVRQYNIRLPLSPVAAQFPQVEQF